ncbi:MAG: DUF362 domain-containing protein [Coriobacteriia bacterium]
MDRIAKPKHKLLSWVYSRRYIVARIFDVLELWMRTSNVPLLGRLHPLTKPENNHFVNLPINMNFETEDVPLPPVVVVELIRHSKYHVIMDHCICRHGHDCQDHAHDIGCLFLGETALDVVPPLSRVVTQEEAIQHVERAVANGLVPHVGRYRADNYAFLVPDRRSFLGVCFCCDCCCFMGYYRHVQTERIMPIYPWLDGLEIEVTDACNGCGACVAACYMKAISVMDGRAVHSEACRGCGRCARACPRGAVVMRLTDPDYLNKTVAEFLSIVRLD